MKDKHRKKPALFRDIALERITELFRQAEIRFNEAPDLSDRYMAIAKKISMKYRVKFPKELKRRICKKCNKFLVPGATCRVRLSTGKIVWQCLGCKNYARLPYK